MKDEFEIKDTTYIVTFASYLDSHVELTIRVGWKLKFTTTQIILIFYWNFLCMGLHILLYFFNRVLTSNKAFAHRLPNCKVILYLGMFYGRHNDLIDHFGTFVSQITTDILDVKTLPFSFFFRLWYYRMQFFIFNAMRRISATTKEVIANPKRAPEYTTEHTRV